MLALAGICALLPVGAANNGIVTPILNIVRHRSQMGNDPLLLKFLQDFQQYSNTENFWYLATSWHNGHSDEPN